MRVDGKPEGLRQSMSWLHTWSGLVLGWLLFAVFFTGTLSYFRTEIDTWMRPELHASVPGLSVGDTVETALATVQRLAPPDAQSWSLSLPGARRTAVDASWREAPPPGVVQQGRGSTKRITLDAATGEQIEPRETRGGGFLYRFHFELYGMPRIWGRWIVGIATMFMFVAIISGVITHKKIFTDFFTFRPKKGQRSWLDSHNATAVLALPFHIVITFSGLLLLINPLMQWTSQSVNGGVDPRGGGRPQMTAQVTSGNTGQRGEGQRGEGQRGEGQRGEGQRGEGQRGEGQRGEGQRGEGQRGEGQRGEGRGGEGRSGEGRGEGRRSARNEAPESVTLAPIGPMLASALQQWPENGIGSITINAPNTPRMTVDLREGGGSSFINRGQTRTLQFDGVTGELRERPDAAPPSVVRATYNVFTGIHMARGADTAVRWLLFLSGLVGTFMAASGMVLWVVKRLPERKKRGYTPFGHHLVEVLNVGAIAGLSVATAVYFWANRLIPADLAGRSDWEIYCFFAAWLLCTLHPLWRACRKLGQRKTWLEQMALAAVLFALLPVLNPLTGGASLVSSILHGQWLIAGFDLMMLALAVLHGMVVWWLLRGKPVGKGTPKAAVKATAAAAIAVAATTAQALEQLP